MLIDSQEAVIMLDEHYHSKPDLIAFSNQRFYGSRIKIMQHRPDECLSGNIDVKKIDGKRDKNIEFYIVTLLPLLNN